MNSTVPIPKSNRSVFYNDQKYTAFRSSNEMRGCITLINRADPAQRIVISSNAHSATVADGDVVIEGESTSEDAKEIETTVKCTPQTWPAKAILPIDVQGCVGRASATLDIFIGPVPKDLHLDVVELMRAGADGESILLLQQRALLAYGRSFIDKRFCWNSVTVPAGGFVMIHLPRTKVPTNSQRDLSVRVLGCFGDGELVDTICATRHLPGEKTLTAPVPETWRAANTPELLSIHRYAVGIQNRRCSVAQRGAMDFNLVKGRPDASSDPTAYPAFGQDVVAPCHGRVIIAEDDHLDMPVGTRDKSAPRGNQICIQRSDGLVVVLAHLQKGSLAVTEGEAVQPGQPLAKVGNSGRSSEPHLHMHLASSPDPMADGFIFNLKGRG